MRAYAYAREGCGESFFHKLIFSYSFLSSFVEGKKKQAVLFIKTSRRSHQNKPSFSPKQAVVLRQKYRHCDKTSENHRPKMDLAQMLQSYWPY